MLTPQKNLWRFVLRSKDRTSGTPNNCSITLREHITENVQDLYVKLSTICLSTFPLGSDLLTTGAYVNGGFSNQPDLPAASATANPFVFTTSGVVDLCLSSAGINTLDSDTNRSSLVYITSSSVSLTGSSTSLAIPIGDRTGIFASGPTPIASGDIMSVGGVVGTVVGFGPGTVIISFASRATPAIPSSTLAYVTSASPTKTAADKTLALIPYAPGDNILRLLTECPWVRMGSTTFGNLQVKLFDAYGFPLKLRKQYASATTTDMLDRNICDWSLQLDVCVNPDEKNLGLI